MQRAFTDDKRETKQSQFSLSLKSLTDMGTFSGYASVFSVVDSHKDMILPGSFEQTLRNNRNIKLLWQHRADEPIGVFTHIEEDSHGLYVEGKLLLDVQRAKEAFALLKSGALEGLSIGYTPVEYAYDPHTGVRVLSKIDLWEVSLVTFPANKEAEITSIKNSSHDEKELAELDEVLQRAITALTSM